MNGDNLSPVQKENNFMGMRRLFIIRKDLYLSAGKLGAMVVHCAEGFWIQGLLQTLKTVGQDLSEACLDRPYLAYQKKS